MESNSNGIKKEKANIGEASSKNVNNTELLHKKKTNEMEDTPVKNSKDLTVKEIIESLKKVIDESNISSSSCNLNKESSSSLNKPINNNERLTKLKNMCKANDLGSNDSSLKPSSEQQKCNNNSIMYDGKQCNEPESIKQDRSFLITEEMYPLTDSFLNQIVSFNKGEDNNNILQNLSYEIKIPKEMDLEMTIKSLVKENINLRMYSKEIEDELKEELKINEMLENENNDLEIKMKNDSIHQNMFITGKSELPNSVTKVFNDAKINLMESILSYFINLNAINEEIISEKGAEHYCSAIETFYNDIIKFSNSIPSSLLQSSIEIEIIKNIEIEFFKYKNSYTFNVTECINRMDELKHIISSLKKEKEALINENKKLKTMNLSIESDIGCHKQSDTQSINSVESESQDVKSMYEIGGDNTLKNSKFSKLTNSAKKIIRNSSNKKLLKDKKSRSRGFSVSLPLKPIDNNKDEAKNKRRNSIIESSTTSITNEIIPHLFVPHSYIKPTKCEICQELCWRKEIRCKTCGYRCHERCQTQAEKVSSCIVNKVQKANKISEMESQKKLFGTTISTYGINEIDYIPYIVKCCINEVEKRGLRVEGIYRKSGNVMKTRNLVQAFDKGDTPDISESGEFPDIAVITSTLKQYFRDLPDALIPERYFEKIKEILDIDDEAEQVNKIKTLIEQLPKTNYETLKFLCIHLNKVDANSDVNLMTSKNLGVVFGPTIIGESGKDPNQNNMISTVCRVRAIDLIIRYAKEIFNYISDEEKNHISLDMLRDIENSINEKHFSIDNVHEEKVISTDIKNEKKSTKDTTSVAQL